MSKILLSALDFLIKHAINKQIAGRKKARNPAKPHSHHHSIISVSVSNQGDVGIVGIR